MTDGPGDPQFSDPNNTLQEPGRGAQGQLGVSRPGATEVLTPEPVDGMLFGNWSLQLMAFR